MSFQLAARDMFLPRKYRSPANPTGPDKAEHTPFCEASEGRAGLDTALAFTWQHPAVSPTRHERFMQSGSPCQPDLPIALPQKKPVQASPRIHNRAVSMQRIKTIRVNNTVVHQQPSGQGHSTGLELKWG